MSLSFLHKKSWHTGKSVNQRDVWHDEEKVKEEAERMRKRSETLEKEKEQEEMERIINGETASQRQGLSFMYKQPESLTAKGAAAVKGSNVDIKTSFHEQGEEDGLFDEDDDPAVRDFKRMMAGRAVAAATANSANTATATTASSASASASAAPFDDDGKPDHRSALEKSVGKRQNSSMTVSSQIALHPELKNAPMAHKSGADMDNMIIKFNPLGKVLRNVRCKLCGFVGHAKGDRECKVGGWDPFSNTGFSKGDAAKSSDTAEKDTSAKSDTTTKKHRERAVEKRDRSDDSDDDSDGSRRRKKKSKKEKKSKKSKKSKMEAALKVLREAEEHTEAKSSSEHAPKSSLCVRELNVVTKKMLWGVLARYKPIGIEYGEGDEMNSAFVHFADAGRAAEVLTACRYGSDQPAFVRIQNEDVDRDLVIKLAE
jgi:hypothetical protein